MTETEGIIVLLLCTMSMIAGWLAGNREKRIDEEIMSAEDWAQHYASVRWVTRRPQPEPDETVAS